MVAVIDDADWDLISPYKWYAWKSRKGTGVYNALRNIARPQHGTARMHVEVARRKGIVGLVDHINGNGLDNRRGNLRLATTAQNMAAAPFYHSISGYRGVVLAKASGRFRALIKSNQKQIVLGTFDTAEEAARAYDQKALDLWGSFARTNFPVHDAPERMAA